MILYIFNPILFKETRYIILIDKVSSILSTYAVSQEIEPYLFLYYSVLARYCIFTITYIPIIMIFIEIEGGEWYGTVKVICIF